MIQTIMNSWLSLLLASIAALVVAMIWYAPPVLGNSWQKLAKIKDSDLKKQFISKSVITVIMVLVTSFVLNRFFIITNPQTLFEALKVVVWLWLGFIVTYVVAGGSFEKIPYKLMAIDLVGQLLILLAMGTVLYYYL